MKLLLATIFLIISVFYSTAQPSATIVETIKGKVINSATSEPVSYTNIGIEGTYYGTASDSEGNFELKIPDEMQNSDIFFSAVGFVNKKFPVKSLFEKEFNLVKIDPQSYDIDDIDIAARSKVLTRILTMANENTPYNFISGPINMEANYINNKTINDTISQVEKATVLIYDETGYASPSKSDAFQNIKYSLKKDRWENDYQFSSGTTNLDDLLALDWVRSASSVLNPEILNGFNLKLESEPQINGKACWIISFSQAKPTLAGSGDFYGKKFEGRITIAKDDYSVIKIEGNIESSKNSRQGRAIALKNNAADFLKNVTYNFSITYENLKPATITLNKKYEFQGNKFVENSTLQIGRVQTTNLISLKAREYFTGE